MAALSIPPLLPTPGLRSAMQKGYEGFVRVQTGHFPVTASTGWREVAEEEI